MTELKSSEIMKKVQELPWDFSESSRSRAVFDLLRILRSHNKARFMTYFQHLLMSHRIEGEKLNDVLSSLHNAEGEGFEELASACISGILTTRGEKNE